MIIFQWLATLEKICPHPVVVCTHNMLANKLLNEYCTDIEESHLLIDVGHLYTEVRNHNYSNPPVQRKYSWPPSMCLAQYSGLYKELVGIVTIQH